MPYSMAFCACAAYHQRLPSSVQLVTTRQYKILPYSVVSHTVITCSATEHCPLIVWLPSIFKNTPTTCICIPVPSFVPESQCRNFHKFTQPTNFQEKAYCTGTVHGKLLRETTSGDIKICHRYIRDGSYPDRYEKANKHPLRKRVKFFA